jgi:hypothetical protein
MSKETQAVLISEIGEMIVEDERYLSNPWQGIGIAVTLNEGSREMSSYRYLEDGSYEAGSPKAGSALTPRPRRTRSRWPRKTRRLCPSMCPSIRRPFPGVGSYAKLPGRQELGSGGARLCGVSRRLGHESQQPPD